MDDDVQRDLVSLIATRGLSYHSLATVLKKVHSNPKLAELPVGIKTIERLAAARFDAIEHVELHGCLPATKETTV